MDLFKTEELALERRWGTFLSEAGQEIIGSLGYGRRKLKFKGVLSQ